VRSDIWYLVLDTAGDEGMLWELTWGSQLLQPGGQEVEIHAPSTVEEVRPVLAEAVTRGLVELYDASDPQGPTLNHERAQAVIGDDGFWIAQSESRPRCCVRAGVDRLRRNRTHAGDRLSGVDPAACASVVQ
jgi:hypothetical protein